MKKVVVSDVMYSVEDHSWGGGLATKGREGGGGVGKEAWRHGGMDRPVRRGR